MFEKPEAFFGAKMTKLLDADSLRNDEEQEREPRR